MLNQTPHAINVFNATTGVTHNFPPTGVPARLAVTQETVGQHPTTGVDIVRSAYGEIENLVSLDEARQAGGVLVSALILGRLGKEWSGVAFAPATAPNDGAIRNEAGQIVAVTKLVTV